MIEFIVNNWVAIVAIILFFIFLITAPKKPQVIDATGLPADVVLTIQAIARKKAIQLLEKGDTEEASELLSQTREFLNALGTSQKDYN